MNDPKRMRTEPEWAQKGIRDRGGRYLPELERLLAADEKRLPLLQEVEEMRARRNAASKAIGQAMKEQNADEAQRLKAEVAELKEKMQAKERELAVLEEEAGALVRGIPNLPHESVPVGKSEADNVEVRSGGAKPAFAFTPKNHADIGEALGILDFQTAAKLSGSRFSILRGMGARLHRAIGQFMINLHVREHGYTEICLPHIVRPEVMLGTGQLPKFEQDLYKTGQFEAEQDGGSSSVSYFIPTAEVPLTNLVREEIVDDGDLPMKFTALTPCYRQEAGSYGKDVRGMIRQHQFEKCELVWVVRPEDSMAALEDLTAHAENVLKQLELPYRVLELCTADIGFSACKTYDLEVWFPGEDCYREVSSCSNCGDFQARRMNARFRRGKKPELVHTLNGSGLAVGRIFAAVLENGQQEDGSIRLPKVLHDYFGAETIAT
ncbi:MAG: serine--tRNA ligase [Elusimicrobiota bacterium]